MIIDSSELLVGDIFTKPLYDNAGFLLAKKDTAVTDVMLPMKKGLACHIDRNVESVRFIPAHEVKLGDYLADAVRGITGVVIAPRGCCVDYELLGMIRRLEGDIAVQASTSVKMPYEVAVTPVAMITDAVRSRVKDSIRYIFNDAGSPEAMQKASDTANLLADTVMKYDYIGANLESLRLRDEYTFMHSTDVALIAILIAKSMHLSEDVIRDCAVAGFVHDLGKIRIPPDILHKPSRLTDSEFNIMKGHVDYGYDIIRNSSRLSDAAKRGAHEHHEKLNGRGYTRGSKDISIIGRILAVADVYDALVTDRPYKSGMHPCEAIKIMLSPSEEGHFDPDVFRAFHDCLILYPEGTKVKLSDGTDCVVLHNNKGYPFRPIVRRSSDGAFLDLLRDERLIGLRIEY